MAIDILAQRQRNARLRIAPILGFQQVPHHDLGLDRVGDFDADRTFSGHGRQNVNALGFQRGGDVVVERGNFFQLHTGRWMQFVAGDRRAFGNVAQLDRDLELGQRLLHEPRVGQQFLFGLGRL